MKTQRLNNFKKGIVDGIPIGLGYFAVSFAFGMTAVSDGLSIWQSTLISLTNLTSAGQVAGLEVIAAKGGYFEIALTQLIINLRYCLMSLSLSQKIDRDEPFAHRFGVAFGITDEIFAVSATKEGKLSPYYSYGTMLMAIPGWTLGTLLGALFGNILPTFIVSALGIAIYGMFIAVVVPPSKKDHVILGIVISAMVISTLFKYIPVLNQVSPGFVIIISTVLVAGIASFLFPHNEEAVVSKDE